MDRRWKVIDNTNFYFRIGEILTLSRDDGSAAPEMQNRQKKGWCNLNRLVEIDEHGQIIRTYKDGDLLNGGTLVNHIKSETLDGISMEIDEALIEVTKLKNDKGRLYSREYIMPIVLSIFSELLRLRDERESNPGVFDNAPSDAKEAHVTHYNSHMDVVGIIRVYGRELPKTLAQEIAEKVIKNAPFCTGSDVYELIVSGISEYARWMNGNAKNEL